jgi:hypothetical protein
MPRVPPPDSISAERPKAVAVRLKNWIFSSSGKSGKSPAQMKSRQRATSSTYSSISRLVPTREQA